MRKEKLTGHEYQELRELIVFLEGYVFAKGDLFVLGTHTLTTLWKALRILKQ